MASARERVGDAIAPIRLRRVSGGGAMAVGGAGDVPPVTAALTRAKIEGWEDGYVCARRRVWYAGSCSMMVTG